MTGDEEESLIKICSKFVEICAKLKQHHDLKQHHVDAKKFREFSMIVHRFTAERGLILPGLLLLTVFIFTLNLLWEIKQISKTDMI